MSRRSTRTRRAPKRFGHSHTPRVEQPKKPRRVYSPKPLSAICNTSLLSIVTAGNQYVCRMNMHDDDHDLQQCTPHDLLFTFLPLGVPLNVTSIKWLSNIDAQFEAEAIPGVSLIPGLTLSVRRAKDAERAADERKQDSSSEFELGTSCSDVSSSDDEDEVVTHLREKKAILERKERIVPLLKGEQARALFSLLHRCDELHEELSQEFILAVQKERLAIMDELRANIKAARELGRQLRSLLRHEEDAVADCAQVALRHLSSTVFPDQL